MTTVTEGFLSEGASCQQKPLAGLPRPTIHLNLAEVYVCMHRCKDMCACLCLYVDDTVRRGIGGEGGRGRERERESDTERERERQRSLLSSINLVLIL